MARFEIHTIAPDNAQRILIYDNEASTLSWEDGEPVIPYAPTTFADATVVSSTTPGTKGVIRTLKISLGLSCNYACSYCSQRFVPHSESTGPQDVTGFLQQLTASVDTPPARIEFWGGEPLVYLKTLRPLANALRELYPSAQFSIITNGSLLTRDINAWLDETGFSVGLSHDGPGQSARGPDPLDEPTRREAIFDLYRRLQPKGRISINPMISAHNPSRGAVQAWLQARFGEDVQIGEGAFIDPYDEGGIAATFHSAEEHARFRRHAFADVRHGAASRFAIASSKVLDFIQSIREQRPARAVGQKCGMDRNDNIAVDLKGNVLTCQNVSAAAQAPNGEPHRIGHLSDLKEVSMRSATHWSHRPQCPSCPVLQLCKGSCMFLEGALWQAGCDAAYSDNVVFLAAAIEFLTGCVPVFIEGDIPPDRKDVFGFIQPSTSDQPKKRVIPIQAVQAVTP